MSLRIVVLGTMASNPYAGMAWMHMQFAAGLLRLGHDAYYFETTSTWPYDPVRNARVCDADYAAPYLRRVAESFGLHGRWAFRCSFLDGTWCGMTSRQATELLADADLVLNVSGATRLHEEGLAVRKLVYVGTDPVFHEVTYARRETDTVSLISEHDATVTYGENIGTESCPLPPLPRLAGRTRQPIIMELWSGSDAPGLAFTTVANWRQEGRDVEFAGEWYYWSKHLEYEKVIDLPARVAAPLELATNLADPDSIHHGEGEVVRAQGMSQRDQERLRRLGWVLRESRALTQDPWTYRDYITASRGEFSVARDINVRLNTGWFSERSACYLAAARPVITQDTGFGHALPTGKGLFAFRTADDAARALEDVQADYAGNSDAARQIAREFFASDVVLPRMLADVGA